MRQRRPLLEQLEDAGRGFTPASRPRLPTRVSGSSGARWAESWRRETQSSKNCAGVEGLNRSHEREAGEGRGHNQSLDTSSLLRRFLCRSAPQTPEGIAVRGREGRRGQRL